MSKLLFYIKSVLHSTFDNKLRAILSVSGIFVAVFVYFCGNVLVNSYYRTNYSEANTFADNTFAVIGDSENLLHDKLNKQPISVSVAQQEKTLIDIYDKEKDRYITVLGSIHFTTENNNIFTAVSHDYSVIAFNGELVKGRFFNSADYMHNKPVVIINEYTEKMLFQGEDSIGKTIRLSTKIAGSEMWTPDSDESYPSLVVVGVIKDTIIDRKAENEYREKLELGNDKNIMVNTVIYCPSSLTTEHSFETKEAVRIFSYDNAADYSTSLEKSKSINTVIGQTGSSLYFLTKAGLMEIIELNMQRMRTFFNIVIVTLLLIIGFSMSVTVIFSMKERISEIGIRKAFGATLQDVLLMCFSELILTSLIGALLATGAGFFASRAIAEYINENLFIFIAFSCTLRDILLPVVMGVTMSLAFGLLPCIYAASVKPINALKFE